MQTSYLRQYIVFAVIRTLHIRMVVPMMMALLVIIGHQLIVLSVISEFITDRQSRLYRSSIELPIVSDLG